MEACVGSVYKIPARLPEYRTLIPKIGRNQTTHYFIVFDGGYKMARYLHDILGALLAMFKKKTGSRTCIVALVWTNSRQS